MYQERRGIELQVASQINQGKQSDNKAVVIYNKVTGVTSLQEDLKMKRLDQEKWQ